MRSIGKGYLIPCVVIVLTVVALFGVTMTFAGDVPTETGVIQKIGESFVTVVIKNGKGFADGTKLTFYFRPKMKIVMAKSHTLLTPDSLLVGDMVQITLGGIEIDKEGKERRYAEKLLVLTGKKRLKRYKARKNLGN